MTRIDQSLPTDPDERYIAGDTARIELTVVTDDESPKDLGGVDITFALADYRGGDALITKTIGDGVTVVDADNGRADIRIESADTADLGDLGGEQYHYQIEVVDNSGDVATVTDGTWTIYPKTV